MMLTVLGTSDIGWMSEIAADVGLFVAFSVYLTGSPGNLTRAQAGPPEYTRQSDVIDGRTFGIDCRLVRRTPASRSQAARFSLPLDRESLAFRTVLSGSSA